MFHVQLRYNGYDHAGDKHARTLRGAIDAAEEWITRHDEEREVVVRDAERSDAVVRVERAHSSHDYAVISEVSFYEDN